LTANLAKKPLTEVNQILTQQTRDSVHSELQYAKDFISIALAFGAQFANMTDGQTDSTVA